MSPPAPGIVFSYRIVYTIFVGDSKAILRDRNQVFLFEGEYFIRSFVCCSMNVMVGSAPKPGNTGIVEALDIRKHTVICKVILGKFNNVFNRLSECSDNRFYPKFFIIRTFPE